MIPKAKIEKIISEADIVKIIGDQIPLQRKGRNYFAVCPFHDDTNPSMVVSSEKKIYKCFSCGAHGNAIKFVENYSHLSFLEALKVVATTTSVDLTTDFKNLNYSIEKYSLEQKQLFQINEDALTFFKVSLASRFGRDALNYLQQRKLSDSEIAEWELGWSPSQVSLYDHLLNKGYTVEQLKAASLITIKDNHISNYFNNRVMFPIRDLDKNLIGFCGRSLHKKEEVKYLNIRETKAFQKSQILFNINHALPSINKTQTIIITEGFMDVFSLSRIQLTQVVATMGTNFSDYHLKVLKKLQAIVILFFDGDAAGVRAHLKAAIKLMQHGLKAKIVNNLTDKDPDELINTNQGEQVKHLIKNALDPWDYALKKLQSSYNISSYDQLKQFLNEVFDILRINDEPIMVNRVLRELETLTHLNYEALHQSYLQTKKEKEINHPHEAQAAERFVSPLSPYRDILGALASDPRYIEIVEANWKLIYQTIDPEDINFMIVLRALIERYRAQTYHPNNWKELSEILSQANFNYRAPKWNFTEQWFKKTDCKSLTPAFLALEEKYWRQKEAYYTIKIAQTTDQQTQQNYLLQKDQTRRKILDLKRKRNEWQWRK